MIVSIRNPNNFQMYISCTAEEIPNIIDDKEIEVLIIASIETLKSQKSKCGKDEIFKLVRNAIEENITREIFDETLDSLIESGSVKCSLISNRTCLSLRKHNVIENSNLQGNFNNFKEVKSFKDQLLDSLENFVDSSSDGCKIFMAHILEEVYFLRKQLKSKDEMIKSLLNQLGKCNDMLQLQQSNQSSSSSSLSSSLSSPSSLSSYLSLLSSSSSSSSLSSSSSSPSSSSSSSSNTNLLPTQEKIEKKLQKNNVHVLNASDSTKTNQNKKDQNRNNKVKSVVVIGNSMIKHI